MVVDKELFQLSYKLLSQVIDGFNVFPTVRFLLDGDDAVIPLFVFLVSLFSFNDPNGTAGQHASGECRLIHQVQNVYGIAVVGLGRRHESEVEGKGHSGWQYFFQFEDPLVWVEGELVSASFWSLDHDTQHLFVI